MQATHVHGAHVRLMLSSTGNKLLMCSRLVHANSRLGTSTPHKTKQRASRDTQVTWPERINAATHRVQGSGCEKRAPAQVGGKNSSTELFGHDSPLPCRGQDGGPVRTVAHVWGQPPQEH
jgi:hypothetical protein